MNSSGSAGMRVMDLSVGIMLIVMGLSFAALQKQQRRARAQSVKRGEMTSEKAAKIDKFMRWAGWAIAISGTIVIALHFAPFE